MRPLDFLPSIKLKLGVVILATVFLTVAALAWGWRAGLSIEVRALIATALGLGLVQVLSRGMTSPLREMAAAASAMARGDYDRRVRATSRDEVGELARAFNRMAADLAGVERMRRDLVANVSHELRTPLAALHGLLENLADGVEEPDPGRLRVALAQTERLGRLVEQLLDLSNLEGGGLPLRHEPFAVRLLLEQVTREASLNGRQVRLRVDVQPGDLSGMGDAERVHQVIANLLDNAVRHSPPEGRVWLCGHSGDAGSTRITVADEGPGIPDSDSDRVFERFYRADAARASSEGGSGLGLAIARSIVEAHGGRIHAERRDPTGCRMVVELPA